MTTLDTLVSLLVAGGVQRVYEMGKVPTTPTYPYAVVGLGSPEKIARTDDGQAADLHTATAQFFGRSAGSVLDIASLGDLDGQFMPDGQLVVRIISTRPYRDPDDQGVLTITHTYRY